ncbi:hypothetical protein ABUK63_09345 [Lactococcus lactis]|uniref:hypothetical protein n=1 Tax=Lactococcus lactis TaxID=1358 RepID=UPI003D2E0486
MIYNIGIVEDDSGDIGKIGRSLFEVVGKNFDLKVYPIETIKNETDFQSLIQTIINDANTNVIHGLIVDYKIMVKNFIGKGNEIFSQIKSEIPLFPVIILTEKVEESREASKMDYDKIYRKEIFFYFTSQESKDQSTSFYKNINLYYEEKQQLESELKNLQEQEIEKGVEGISGDTVLKMAELEEKLSNYEKDERSNLDRIFDINKLSEALDIINKLNMD